MSTMQQLKKIAASITGLGNAVSNTFAESAHEITSACQEVFGRENWDIDKADITTVVNTVAEAAPWKGTTSETARKSEVIAIIKGYPHLAKACQDFRRTYGELRREHLVKIARIAPTSASAADTAGLAVEFFETRDKSRGKGATPKAKSITELVSGIFKVSTRKQKEIKFRKELAALCLKHDITYNV
jgi:hypothetical protein